MRAFSHGISQNLSGKKVKWWIFLLLTFHSIKSCDIIPSVIRKIKKKDLIQHKVTTSQSHTSLSLWSSQKVEHDERYKFQSSEIPGFTFAERLPKLL